MTCENCNEGELVPTQVPRLSQGLGRTGYAVALGTVLILGAFAGLGLAVALEGGFDLDWALVATPVIEGGFDLDWALVATPVILVACTPLVFLGAMRAFAEKKVWHCEHCDYIVDRA